MIINIDVKSLEWCSYLFLSQDKTGIDEWISVLEDPTKMIFIQQIKLLLLYHLD